jgi:hypothetical protein
MQSVNSSLQAILDAGINANANDPTRDFTTVVEFYTQDYTPSGSGFNPADAEERFAPITLTWNGLAYRREIISWGEVSRFMGKQTNSCTVRFSNVSRYLATWIVANDVEGMHMIVRLVSRSITTDSIVLYAGKVDKPAEFDRQTAIISSKQGITIEQEVPPRSFLPEDDAGRTPDDVLYEGFRFVAVNGSFFRTETSTRTSFFGLRNRQVTLAVPAQFSSMDDTPYGNPVPETFGRVQVELIPIMFADTGSGVRVLAVASNGPIAGIENARNATNVLGEFAGQTIHLGDLGGTGTNANDPFQFPGAGKFSHTAYVDGYVRGGDVNTDEGPPTLVAVIMGRIIPLPDGSGDFTLEGWTHSGPYITRFLLNDANWGNIAEAFINDASVINSATICAEPLEDVSQREQLILPNTDLPEHGNTFTRYRSTGILDPLRSGYDLGIYDTPIGFIPADPTGYDETNPPTSFTEVTYLRERYTTNFAVREKVKLVDLLYDVVLRSFRGYLVINAKGQIEVRVERPADNGLLRGATLVGATQIAVDDVTPWKTGELLLRGKVLIGFGLTTSEVRTVSSAVYSTAGNSITLDATVTGSITATKSGATLSGGSSSVPSSGTVSIGGTPAASASVTIAVDGVSIVHTLDAYDTKETVAKMLSLRINANETLKRYVVASYSIASPYVVTITSKLGLLNVPALAYTHSIGEEVIRVMMSFSDASKNADGTVSNALKQAGLTRNNTIANSFKWPLGGKQSSINRIEINYREAKDDFAATRLFVNDVAHQAQIRKKNVLKVDGSAIDNFHQASRIANAALSKNREGDWFASWQTADPNAMLLEEGDVICASDASGGLVNQVVRVEEVRISSERVVSIMGRRYSTNMFSDTVTSQVIPLPTTLRYTATRPSILELIDGPPTRDADGQVPGTYAVVSYDEDILGDHRGASLYADYGDGDKFLAKFDALGIIGVCTTTLPTVTNPGWDRTSTLTVNPYRGALTSRTEDELRADRLVNLMAVGSEAGGWEYAQFADVLDNGDGTYTLSTFLRGCFGTDDALRLTHGASERFAMMDAAQFIPIPAHRLNQAYPYRAPTTNEDVAAAAVVSHTFDGGTARTLAPVYLTADRNVEGDILFRCSRQARFGQGMTSSSNVPLGEEELKFLFELFDGSTLKHSMTVYPHVPQAAILAQLSTDFFGYGQALYDKNNIFGYTGAGYAGSGSLVYARLDSQRIVGTDSFVEAELVGLSGAQYVVGIALYAPNVFPSASLTADIKYGILYNVSSADLFIYKDGVLVKTLSNSSNDYVGLGHRLSIRFSGTEVRFHVDYRAGKQPIYIDYGTPSFPYVVGAMAGYKTEIRGIIIDQSGERVSVTYSAEQQVDHFGSLQNPIKVRVSQVSSIVGPGAYREATI